MQTKALPGFREFYPADLALRTHIFRTWRTVATRYGFEEYDGPPLEPLELYTAKSGDEIVGQLYNFTDKGEREVALRPEMTPTLARMVAARANGLKKPIRWFAIPQLFRYERQQRGRLREHFQLNCDLIGEPGPLGDAEIIALAIDVMRAFGLGPADVRVRLSDRRVLSALLLGAGVDEPQLGGGVSRRSTRSSGCDARRWRRSCGEAGVSGRRGDRASSRSPRCAGCRRSKRRWPACPRRRGGRAAAPAQVVDALAAMGLGEFVEVDLTIVRGLAYYTGTVFELFDAGRTLRAICGGGRYDGLLAGAGRRRPARPRLRHGRRGAGGAAAGPRAGADGRLEHRRVPRRGHRGGPAASCSRLAHELRDAGLRAEYALGAPGGGQAAQAGRRAERAARGGDRAGRAGPGRGDAQGSGGEGAGAAVRRERSSSGRPDSAGWRRARDDRIKARRSRMAGHQGADHSRRGLQRLVQRGHRPRRAGGLQPGARLHGHPAERLRHLGADAARAGPDVQGHRPPERLLPALHSAELSLPGGGARGGLRARSRRW